MAIYTIIIQYDIPNVTREYLVSKRVKVIMIVGRMRMIHLLECLMVTVIIGEVDELHPIVVMDEEDTRVPSIPQRTRRDYSDVSIEYGMK